MITLKNITKSYGPFKALDDLNLSIPKGEIFGLLGPNGAGKTTLIKLITGQLSPSDGNVSLFEGQAPHDIETRKHLGVMPQDLALYPELSVSENMKFFGHLYGLKKEGLSKGKNKGPFKRAPGTLGGGGLKPFKSPHHDPPRGGN